MKIKFTNLLPVAAFACLMLGSCKKESATDSSSISEEVGNVLTVNDMGSNEIMSDDELEDEADDATVSGSSSGNGVVSSGKVSNDKIVSCRTVTSDAKWNVYPRTRTVDYGTGCNINVTGGTAYIISGKKIVQLKADWYTAPAGTEVSSTTYSNYKTNGYSVIGIKRTSVVSNSGGVIVLKIDVTLSYRDSSGITGFTSTTTKQVQTQGTKTYYDDSYVVTGKVEGSIEINTPISPNTISAWSSEISATNPLERNASCPWTQMGVENIQVIYLDLSVEKQVVNYGADKSSCDNDATLTINSGTPKAIKLPYIYKNSNL